MKRIFDIFGSLFGLALLSPLFLILAALVKMQDAGPVFHRATRVGRDGRLFKLVKFRTMMASASELGPGITISNDARITGIGRWLRKTKLDELPQLWNVLLGEMSFVGPRPEDPRYVELYTPEQRSILSLRPGITSPATLDYRHEERMLVGEAWERHYIDEILPTKLAAEQEYASRRTLASDVWIIMRTIAAVFDSHQ